jgi:hypothetical protein
MFVKLAREPELIFVNSGCSGKPESGSGYTGWPEMIR